MIPVSLLLLWVLIGTSEVVGEVVSTADRLGLLINDTPAWSSTRFVQWSGLVGNAWRLRIPERDSLQWAELTESFTRNKLPQIVLQVAIALLYLSWIAIWWARQTRREHSQLLEG